MKFKDTLKKLDACNSAIEWVGEKTAQQSWDQCKNGSWMLWLMKAKYKNKVPLAIRKKLVLCACDIAETVLKNVPKDEKRPAEAVRLARAWAKGEKVTLDEVKHAASNAAACSSSRFVNASRAASGGANPATV